MIITIDGPAGAGKSSVARALARRLGFAFLDTGAMYRAVALAGKRKGLDWDQPGDLADLAHRIDLNLEDDRIYLDGEDVSEEIRTSDVTAVTRYAADNQQVRRHLVDLQRAAAAGKNIVTEGRDQGTLAFPNAQCKIFLTASPQERAQAGSATSRPRASRSASSKSWPHKTAATRKTPPEPWAPWFPPPTPYKSRPTAFRSIRWSINWKRSFAIKEKRRSDK